MKLELLPSRVSLRALAFVLLGLSFSTIGCRSGDTRFKPVYPVSGEVSFDGKVPAGAVITLHPVAGQEDPLVKPSGEIDADGKFVLSTYNSKDGAPAGTYIATIVWLPKGYAGPIEKANKLPMRYANIRTSNLGVEIKKSNNELPVFQLSK